MNKIIALVLLAAFSAFAAEKVQECRIYYVSADGSDAADGLSESTAWRTLEKLNASLPHSAEATALNAGRGRRVFLSRTANLPTFTMWHLRCRDRPRSAVGRMCI